MPDIYYIFKTLINKIINSDKKYCLRQIKEKVNDDSM